MKPAGYAYIGTNNNNKKTLRLIDVPPEDLAAQLTLIDLPIFKSITRDELQRNSSDTTRRHGQSSCPNVMAMKRQFNQLTFWVVDQILRQSSPRQRANSISYFVKTAKNLHQLNNLHSANAIVSALLISSIYRLEKTWHCFNKKYPKDRTQFDKLHELFSDTNNYEALRKHLASCSLPCIPYLGLFSRDMIYIQEAHQEREVQRTKSTCMILDLIERFQSSTYDDLVPLPEVQSILASSRYIDELQKFIEDANYRRSLELEPPADRMRTQQHWSFNNLNTTWHDNGNTVNNNNNGEVPKLPVNNSDSNLQVDKFREGQQKGSSKYANNPRNPNCPQARRSNMLSGITSMVHSAVVSTSHRLSGVTTPPAVKMNTAASCTDLNRYLIDDSYICAAIAPAAYVQDWQKAALPVYRV